MTYSKRVVAALLGLVAFSGASPAQGGGSDYSSTDLMAGSQPNSGKMTVSWRWTAVSTSDAVVEVFEHLEANPDGTPKLGSKSSYTVKQSGTTGSSSGSTGSTTAVGGTGTQYISRIQLKRNSSVVQTSYSVAVRAP